MENEYFGPDDVSFITSLDTVNSIYDLDFDSIMRLTGEDRDTIIENTLSAWADSYDYRKRTQAAYEGGPQHWDRLLHDESCLVRAALSEVASERFQLELTNDVEPYVRNQLARYGTEKVRQALVSKPESDLSVISTIAEYSSVETRKALVSAYWDKPSCLLRIIPYAVNSDLNRLADHPNLEIRIATAMYGSREICERILSKGDLGANRFVVEDRIQALDELAAKLHIRGREPPNLSYLEPENLPLIEPPDNTPEL